jgi:ADP-ribosyl-[dinitrogen reductase] hydrolase
MRVAPAGLFIWRHQDRHQPGRLSGSARNSPPSPTATRPVQLTGGVLAVLVRRSRTVATLVQALADAKPMSAPGSPSRGDPESTRTGRGACGVLDRSEEAIAELGEGWVAEEALAISVYCALVARDFRQGVVMAVNHDGDSDSTGAITGNLLGALHGVDAIPARMAGAAGTARRDHRDCWRPARLPRLGP